MCKSSLEILMVFSFLLKHGTKKKKNWFFERWMNQPIVSVHRLVNGYFFQRGHINHFLLAITDSVWNVIGLKVKIKGQEFEIARSHIERTQNTTTNCCTDISSSCSPTDQNISAKTNKNSSSDGANLAIISRHVGMPIPWTLRVLMYLEKGRGYQIHWSL